MSLYKTLGRTPWFCRIFSYQRLPREKRLWCENVAESKEFARCTNDIFSKRHFRVRVLPPQPRSRSLGPPSAIVRGCACGPHRAAHAAAQGTGDNTGGADEAIPDRVD